MSILHPQTAEDRMAWVPIIGCAAPLVLLAIIVAVVLS